METAIVVAVPGAEPLVSRWRRQYTSDGAEGMPAHITLLYPFADTEAPRDDEIEDVLRAFPQVPFSLAATAYFHAPSHVLYLAPTPSAPFNAMTDALVARFPEHPPYGGAHEDVIPHLTVADHDDLEVLAEIERDVSARLPIQANVSEAQLMEHAPEGWHLRRRFALRS
jgi:2'-5' RNA ligase